MFLFLSQPRLNKLKRSIMKNYFAYYYLYMVINVEVWQKERERERERERSVITKDRAIVTSSSTSRQIQLKAKSAEERGRSAGENTREQISSKVHVRTVSSITRRLTRRRPTQPSPAAPPQRCRPTFYTHNMKSSTPAAANPARGQMVNG